MTTEDDPLALRDKAREVLERVRSASRDQALWVPGVPRLHIVAKALLARQAESLAAAIVLADAGQGAAALPFVRPACEEYFWLKYLISIDRSDAEATLDHFELEQLLAVTRAQEGFAGKAETVALGLAGFTELYEQAVAARKNSRSALAQRLNWGGKAVKQGRLPSTSFIAQQAGEGELYDYLYGATSRHVHFNVPELLRRVWGINGIYSVGSPTFYQYFTAFALFWTSRLLLDTFLASEPLLPGTVSRFLGPQGRTSISTLLPRWVMPIVTAEELRGVTRNVAPSGLTSG